MANAILALEPLTLVKRARRPMVLTFSIGVRFFGAATGVPFYGLPAYARPVSAPPAEES
jgi:hypothetical protein